MDNGEELLSEFLEKINRMIKELEELEDFAYDISALYNINKFPEQENLSVQLENLGIAITHETASQISFLKSDIEELSKFISFREKCNEFTDTELAEILDDNLKPKSKKNLLSKFGNAVSMINRVNDVYQSWNKIFNNSSYLKIKKKLRI